MMDYEVEFSGDGRKLYNELAAQGASDKLFTLVDSPLLMVYCEEWAAWKKATIAATMQVYKTKDGSVAVNPSVWIASAKTKTLLKAAEQLGISPIGRAKMAIEIDDEDKDLQGYINKVIARRSGKQDKVKKKKGKK